jgi:hypothetical protein
MVATTIDELRALLTTQLAHSPPADRARFEQVAIPPARWALTPWGDDTGGFRAVAVLGNRVLWYNEIEDGFNVSEFFEHGVIPSNEYWCNQDEIAGALRSLFVPRKP